MAMRGYYVRLPSELLRSVAELCEEEQMPISEFIRRAVLTAVMNSETQSQIVSDFKNKQRIKEARENSKIAMRRFTFLTNVQRKLIQFSNMKTNEEQLKDLLRVWSEEAEALGYDKTFFLEYISKTLQEIKGVVPNEIIER